MENDSVHFRLTYWFVVGIAAFVLSYVIMITFFTIPKENQRFVDIALAFLLGLLSGVASFLTGGNPAKKSSETTPLPGTANAKITADITTIPNEAASE